MKVLMSWINILLFQTEITIHSTQSQMFDTYYQIGFLHKRNGQPNIIHWYLCFIDRLSEKLLDICSKSSFLWSDTFCMTWEVSCKVSLHRKSSFDKNNPQQFYFSFQIPRKNRRHVGGNSPFLRNSGNIFWGNHRILAWTNTACAHTCDHPKTQKTCQICLCAAFGQLHKVRGDAVLLAQSNPPDLIFLKNGNPSTLLL